MRLFTLSFKMTPPAPGCCYDITGYWPLVALVLFGKLSLWERPKQYCKQFERRTLTFPVINSSLCAQVFATRTRFVCLFSCTRNQRSLLKIRCWQIIINILNARVLRSEKKNALSMIMQEQAASGRRERSEDNNQTLIECPSFTNVSVGRP